MKKFLAASGMAAALMTAAPAAQAGDNLFGQILNQVIASQFDARFDNNARSSRHHADRHRAGRYHNAQPRQSLAAAVRKVERRTGGTITHVRLSRNKRFYVLRGHDRYGRAIKTRIAANRGGFASNRSWQHRGGSVYEKRQRHGFSHWRGGLRKQNYSRFSRIKAHDDYYDVRARDGRGRNVALQVCAYTGKVLKRRYY